MTERKKLVTLPEKLSIEKIPALFKEIKKLAPGTPIEVDFSETQTFDSSGIAFVNYLKGHFETVELKNLKPEFNTLFTMFPSTYKKKKKSSPKTGKALIAGVGRKMDRGLVSLGGKMSSIKENLETFFVLLTDEIFYTAQYIMKRRGIYPGEIWNQLFFMAYQSFPIVAMISFLVGVTISITSAEQLHNFGADIYLADLVGYGMVRELVPLMTGIILAGKIGASITAEISSMKVLEETDALKTMGIIPEKFLMVPRLLAITIAIPLLVTIADIIGIIGGMLVGKFFSGIPYVAFYNEMMLVVGLKDFLIGMGKTLSFGWVVVISSGFKAFTVERSPTGVGVATTECVVLSISLIIILDCIFALLLY
ncbi:MAG: hypothetical protein GY757_56370 [bacterium]|nr:hypothetical protein [bacterium]